MSTNATPGVHDDEALHEHVMAQSLVFTLLARVFSQPPEVAFLDALAGEALYDDWPLPAGHSSIQRGLVLLRAFGTAWEADQITSLRADYNRLFVGPDHLLAPPWESVYRSKDGLVFERETLEVRAAYAQFGLRVPHLNSEPDDHLGYELAFIAHLAGLSRAALAEGDPTRFHTLLRAQHEFFEAHLQRWAALCLRRIIDHAGTDFFRGIAHLTLGTLDDTAAFVAKVCSEGAA